MHNTPLFAKFTASTPLRLISRRFVVRGLMIMSLVLSLMLSLILSMSANAEVRGTPLIKSDRLTLDHEKIEGRKWMRIDFSPEISGTHTLRVYSDGNADIHFSVFKVLNNSNTDYSQKMATVKSTGSLTKWTGTLESSDQYYLGVWAVSGSGNFEATIEAGTTKTATPPIETTPPVEATTPEQDTPPENKMLTTKPGQSWHVRGTTNVVLTVGDTVFIGGEFTEIYNDAGGSLPRGYLAALNRYTGKPTSFAPTLDDKVIALSLSPDKRTLYVGGAFFKAEGQSRNRIAAYDLETGALTDFVTTTLHGAVHAIAVDDRRLYLGGVFTKVGNENRPYLAAFDSVTGDIDRSFTASPNARVTSLVAGIDRLWVGGDFTRLNGTYQKGIGAVDPLDGSLQATDDVAYPVIALAVSDTQLFIAGGGPGGRAAAFNRATGVEQWEISSDGNFQAVDVDEGRYVYFGGHHEIIEGNSSIDRLARHDKATGKTDLSWLPRINGIRSINAVDVTPDGLYIGGDFTRVSGESHEGFARLPGLTR